MAGLGIRGRASVIGQAQVDSSSQSPAMQGMLQGQPSGPVNLSSPATWGWIIFGLCAFYVVGSYFGFGGMRGAVL